MRNTTQQQPRKTQADVLAFAAKVARPRSRLGLWESEIFELLALGVSYRQVQAFLAQRGTTVDVSAIHRFVHAKKRAHLLTQVQTRLQQAAPQAALSPSPAAQQVAQTGQRALAPKPAAAKPPVAPPPPAPGSIPKFTWNPDQYNIEDLK